MKLPLKFLIILVTTVSLFVTLAVVFATEYYVNRQTLTESTLELNYSNAQKLSTLTNDTFILMRESLQANHANVLENWDDPEELTSILKTIQESNFNFNSVTIINDNGTGRANYPDIGLVGIYVNTEGVRQGIELQQDFISNPYIGTNNKLMLIVSTALYQNGEYYGMLNGLVWLEEQNFLTRLLEQTYGDDSTLATVYDNEGHYIYHPRKEWIGSKVFENQATSDLAQDQSGKSIIEDRTGAVFYAGYDKVEESDWGIVSMTPEEIAIAPAELSAQRAIVISLPFILAAFLVLLGLILFITRPLNRLSQVDYSKPIHEVIQEMQTIPSPYRESAAIKQMILSFAQNQQQLLGELESLAITDPLTGLVNRRRYAHMLELIHENQEPFGLVILDIDHFKSINDSYGHLIGDQVLIKLGELMKSSMPATSLPVRLGGEEFAFVIQGTTEDEVVASAERFRQEVEHTSFPAPQTITVSIGVGYFDCTQCDLEAFFSDVDTQLYKAKANGRNRIERVSFINGTKEFS